MNTKRAQWIPIAVLFMALAPAAVVGQNAEEQIQSALDRATEAGIPTSLLESKIREGQAKGVPTDRIADAVQRRLDGLAGAGEALAGVPDVSPDDLDVAADALESGVSGAVLAELAETASGERRAAAIAALSYLVDAEVAPEEALARVEEALARGPEALQNLPVQARAPGNVGTAGAPAGPPAEIPAPANIPTELGPPGGIPAPGEAPAGARPGGAGPPSNLPGGPPGA